MKRVLIGTFYWVCFGGLAALSFVTIAWPTAILSVAGLGVGWTGQVLFYGGLLYYLTLFLSFGGWRLLSVMVFSALIPITMLTERYLYPFYGIPWTDKIGLATMSWAIFFFVYGLAALVFPGRWLRGAFLDTFPER